MQQYLVVQQENPTINSAGSGQSGGAQGVSLQPSSGALANQQTLGNNSQASTLQNSLSNFPDKSIFMRHGDLQMNLSIDFKHLRDLNNVLGLLSKSDHEEKVLFTINQDTFWSVCKFHNIEKKEIPVGTRISSSPQKQKTSPLDRQSTQEITQPDSDIQETAFHFNFQYFMVVEMSLNGKALEPKLYTGINSSYEIKEKMVIPIRYCDLSPLSILGVSLYDMKKPFETALIGSTTIDLFDQKLRLRQGTYNLFIWEKRLPDMTIASETPGLFEDKEVGKINRLLGKVDYQQKFQVARDNKQWLDRLAKEGVAQQLFEAYMETNRAFLEVAFPNFGKVVLYQDNMNHKLKHQYIFSKTLMKTYHQDGLTLQRDSLYNEIQSMKTQQSVQSFSSSEFSGIFKFHDPMMMMNTPEVQLKTNPITEKYYILTRDADDSIVKEIRPSAEEKRYLDSIIDLPDFMSLNIEQTTTIWYFRYSLVENKKALVKFLKCIEWAKEKEEKEGMALMKKWAEIDLDQALPLLSYSFSANDIYQAQSMTATMIKRFTEIRALAVKCLEKQSLLKINSIMLQLIQAYRYENFANSALTKFLLNTVVKDEVLANSFHWHVRLERENQENGSMMDKYDHLYNLFLDKLEQDNPYILESINQQIELRDQLFSLAETIKRNKKEKVDRRTATLKKVVARGGEFDMSQFDKPKPIPIDPEKYVRGIEPNSCFVFKSAMCPMKLTFHAQNGLDNKKKETFQYSVMYKHGDDVRQDQLVLQMITLMDNLLKDINLDCQFTPYRTLACSNIDGMVEFVPNSKTIQDILAKNNNRIDLFLDNLASNEDDKNKIKDTYLKSCAGYCTVTYLLAVGDRHLENLLIDNTGHLFHVDFGFIFGKQPPGKNILTPPIRICKEMIEGMGGNFDPNYEKFKQYCVSSFNYLRNYQGLILNLLHLMIHAGIKDLTFEDHEKILNSTYDKFLPNKTNIEAEQEFVRIIKESVNAFFPKVMEKFHVWAQYMK